MLPSTYPPLYRERRYRPLIPPIERGDTFQQVLGRQGERKSQVAIVVGHLLFSAVEVIVFPSVCWSVFVSGRVVRLIGAGGSSLHFGEQGRGYHHMMRGRLNPGNEQVIKALAHCLLVKHSNTLTLMRATVDVSISQ